MKETGKVVPAIDCGISLFLPSLRGFHSPSSLFSPPPPPCLRLRSSDLEEEKNETKVTLQFTLKTNLIVTATFCSHLKFKRWEDK